VEVYERFLMVRAEEVGDAAVFLGTHRCLTHSRGL
jgi:hypothetical protein